MTGFLLAGGLAGCPPTEAAPAGYVNPFRFDPAGRLWLTPNTEPNFQYRGEARHDTAQATMGADSAPNGGNVTIGTRTALSVTNTTNRTMLCLLGIDLLADIQVRDINIVRIRGYAQWDGVDSFYAQCSSIQTLSPGSAAVNYVRSQVNGSISPYDPGVSSFSIAPGATASIGAQLYSEYIDGSPGGFDNLRSANMAVRVYSYLI